MRSASFASVLATEVCYRKFANQRAVASQLGLGATPYDSEGGSVRVDVDAFRRKREGIRHVIDGHGFNQTLGSCVGELGGDRLRAALFS